MPYFRDTRSFEIVYNKHEFNSLSLDGIIEKIPSDAECLIIGHMPTKQFDYQYWVVDFDTPEKALDRVALMGLQKQDGSGKPYYKVILKEDLDNYTTEFNLKEKKGAQKPTQMQPPPGSSIWSLGPDIRQVSGSNTIEGKTETKPSTGNDNKVSVSPTDGISNRKLYRNNETSLK